MTGDTLCFSLFYFSFCGCTLDKVPAFQYADGVILLIYFPPSSDIGELCKENGTSGSSLSFTVCLETSKQVQMKNYSPPHSTLC